MGERRLEYMRVRDLVDAPRNAKQHDATTITAAVNRFGFIDPIVLDERTGRIIAGHGRTDHLREQEQAGRTPPGGIEVDDDGAWRAPVVRGWASSDDAEAEAVGIALNRANQKGGWKRDVLAEVLGDLSRADAMDGVGFDTDDLKTLGVTTAAAPSGLPDGLDLPGAQRATPAPRDRAVQGLHEVILVYQADPHREYLEHLTGLQAKWGEPVTGLVVARAVHSSEMSTTEQPARWIEYVPVEQLQPAVRNAKDHDSASIAGSITRFGYVEPIVLDERTNRIIAGHGRRQDILDRHAAGATPPEGVTVDGDGRWLVPLYRGWGSRNDTEADAAAITLNRTPERGGWNLATLQEALTELGDTPAGLDGTGFTWGELDDLGATLGDELVLPPQATDADYKPGADEWAQGVAERGGGQTKRGQGLNEVVLMMQGDTFRQFQADLAVIRRAWREDPHPLIVLRAMREANEQ